MAVIKSGATTDQWTVDPTSKAGRVTLYDTSGSVVSPAVASPTGSAVPANAVFVGGTDGTNLRAISMDSSGQVKVLVQNTPSVTVSGSVSVTQGTSPWVVSLTSTTITGTVAVTQSTSPWVTNMTQWASTALGVPTNFGTTPGTVIAGSVNSSVFIGTTAAVAAAAGVQKVGISGNAGATLDAALTASTAPANGLSILQQYNTTAPAPTNGQTISVQGDQAGNQLNFPGLQFKAGAAWTSATAINTLQFQTGTATQGGLSIASAIIIQLDQTTTLTGGAVTFQGTYDNINWITLPASQIQVLNAPAPPTTINPYTFVANANLAFLIQTNGCVAIRANLTTVITGTGSVTPFWATLSNPSVQYPGGKATYRAATAVLFAAAAGTGIFFALFGSSTKVIRVQRIVFSGINSATLGIDRINLMKCSTAPATGTIVTLTQVPSDSISPAATASLCQVYTAAPGTAPTKVGDIGSRGVLAKAATTAEGATFVDVVFDFRSVGAPTEVVLRGTAQGVAAYFNVAPGAAANVQAEVEWTEE